VEAILPVLIAQAWASGINAYAVVLVLNVGARLGFGDVPEELTRDWVLAAAFALFCLEFVADKIPYVDHVWDAIHTAVRPAIGASLGVVTAEDAGADTLVAGLGSGGLALIAHATKAGIRAGINTSPEPVSTAIASSVEDSLVAMVVGLVFLEPWVAAIAALALLIAGFFLLAFAVRVLRRVRSALAPPPPPA
jgi:hypothetical protein